ncbi:putative cyclitol dehydrogenase AcbL [Mycobacterium ulcerans str. Harvey]|uniref:Cyclitol dehydrogenase AcbL n=1 Tax=Mycobacterium ulcerans str. Harvey TaxID=1299332 RepID=A0ABN0R6G8_MYCUL|nr:putative cyclitol dehydrogenase AcbL [Mycobacterium ulcerans str. Harvey]
MNAGLVVSVPSSAANDVLIGALAEPLASAIYGLEIAMAVFEDTPRSLVVWGDGIVGQLAAAVWRQAMPETEQLIVGRNRDSHNCIAADDPDLPSRLAALRGPVSAVLATPRSATVTALTTLDSHIDHALTVDVHGGLDSGPVSLRSGEVDVAAVRAANCGGLSSVPVAKTLQRAGAGRCGCSATAGCPTRTCAPRSARSPRMRPRSRHCSPRSPIWRGPPNSSTAFCKAVTGATTDVAFSRPPYASREPPHEPHRGGRTPVAHRRLPCGRCGHGNP